jgi:hypothetical protein
MRAFLRDNSLSIACLVAFLISLVGQALSGHQSYNDDQLAHGGGTISLGRYVVSSSFGAAVMENWQSEFLQFTFFILVTVWLVQKGSNESKRIEEAGLEADQVQKVGEYADLRSPRWAKLAGWRRTLYSNSLVLAMTLIFFGSWGAQSLTAWNEFNNAQLEHNEPTVSWAGYLGRADFWEKTFQNWQSEFLAVGTLAVFTVYLRQRGSPESKPVGAPHDETATSG